VAAGARGPQAAPENPLLRRRRALRELGFEEGDADVEVAAEAARARDLAEEAQAAPRAVSFPA
jgi:hypothetical protein